SADVEDLNDAVRVGGDAREIHAVENRGLQGPRFTQRLFAPDLVTDIQGADDVVVGKRGIVDFCGHVLLLRPQVPPQRRVLPRERQAGDRAIERRLELGTVEGFAKVIVGPVPQCLDGHRLHVSVTGVPFTDDVRTIGSISGLPTSTACTFYDDLRSLWLSLTRARGQNSFPARGLSPGAGRGSTRERSP